MDCARDDPFNFNASNALNRATQVPVSVVERPLFPCCIMFYSDYTSLTLPVCVALPVWFWLRRRQKNALPHPPGPKGYPLIGNVLDFPTGVPLWRGLATMAKQYGRNSHSFPKFPVASPTPFNHRYGCPLPQCSGHGHGGSQHFGGSF